MAKVAPPGSLPSTSLQIGGGALNVGPMLKRKTPSELRGEQLKMKNVIELIDESPAPLLGSVNNTGGAIEVNNGPKKPDLSRNPRFIDTRVDEVYPVKKSRLRMVSAREDSKDKENVSTESTNTLKNLSLLSSLAAKRRQLSCPDNVIASHEVSQDGATEARQKIEKCSQSIFRSVAELSAGGERSSGMGVVDMDKALKGLVAHGPPVSSGLTADSFEKVGNQTLAQSSNFCSECHIPGQKIPLDFTLKTKMRIASSYSVNWIHRSVMCSAYNGMPHCMSKFGYSVDHNCSGQALTSQILSAKALHSWVYPQSVLPPSVISVLTSSAAVGETDFLRKRQLAWEDAFRSLYYMLRKNICNVFYVCTSHFAVMFTSSDSSGRSKNACNAYISQSTRSLRSLLRVHDVCFSMPLCNSKVEQVATEDLVELSEIEKQNLGQTRRPSSLSDIDNSPQSLLAFCGNKNAHGLYDFLLNYRSILTFLSGVDVPVLYSPVPFQNAALSAPEIRCAEMKRAIDHITASTKESINKDGETTTGLYSIIEIKDAYIPSWIVSRVCALISSEGMSFEASFVTEHTSIGLNVALGKEKSDSEAVACDASQESSYGIAEAVVTPCLSSGFLNGLKYRNGSYIASLSPV